MAIYTIEISDEDYNDMVDNKYEHRGVLTTDTMLDILHDIVDQIVD